MAGHIDRSVNLVDENGDPINSGNPLSTIDSSGGGTTTGPLTDRSGTITSGGTSQQVAAANSSRKYFMLQNISDETMWIDFGVSAVQDTPSIKITTGGAFFAEGSFVSDQVINIISATTGKKFVSKEG